MMHPSYIELMNVVNEGSSEDNPVVRSRYSIVIAAAKRARQLIDGAEPTIETEKDEKPLSIAVEELYESTIHILPEDEKEEEDPSLFFTEEEMEEVEERGTAYEEKMAHEQEQVTE